MEVFGNELKTYAMDHYGLVAAVCKDIGIAKKLMRVLFPQNHPKSIN